MPPGSLTPSGAGAELLSETRASVPGSAACCTVDNIDGSWCLPDRPTRTGADHNGVRLRVTRRPVTHTADRSSRNIPPSHTASNS